LSISFICSLAKSGSTIESGSVWKARSQAAYQGYSHLSGMEMMSFVQHVEPLRVPGIVISGMERVGVVLVQPVVTVEEEELLAPEHAG
jgi:hypothetical protein